jgi:hypothetical protein
MARVSLYWYLVQVPSLPQTSLLPTQVLTLQCLSRQRFWRAKSVLAHTHRPHLGA